MAISFDYYGRADNVRYFVEGLRLAQGEITETALMAGHSQVWGTPMMIKIARVPLELLGASYPSATLLFACLAFWSQFLLLCVLKREAPRGDFYLGALLLLFAPSLVFWTAVMGKEAVSLFGIALFVHSLSRLRLRFGLGSVTACLGGLLAIGVIRPHMAGILSVCALVAYFVSAPGSRIRSLPRRVAALVFLAFCSLWATRFTQEFLRLEEFTLATSVEFLEGQADRTALGGSAWGADTPLFQRLLLSPTILVRPFPWEASSATGLVTALEGVLLVGLIASRGRRSVPNAKTLFSEPLVLFSAAFLGSFLLLFTSMSNWGLIARQRSLVMPFVFFLLASGSMKRRAGDSRR